MNTQLIRTASELLPATQQQRAELPVSAVRTTQGSRTGADCRLVIELALTIELQVRNDAPPSSPEITIRIRMI